jgi:F-type H+-transporting ATPase subunit delta
VIKGSLAKRYARALMSIGREAGLYERLGRELAQLAEQASGNEDFRLALTAPIYSKDARDKLIEGIGRALGLHELMVRFLKLLNEKGRLAYLPKISGAFESLVDEELGRVRAGVVTAAPLSAAAQNQLRAVLAAITGREVIMDSAVDPEIIGGVVTRVAGKLFDGSIRTQLSLMEEKLKTTSAS